MKPAKGPSIEYDIALGAAGEFSVAVYASPSLDVLNRGGLRYAVSVDDGAPVIGDLMVGDANKWGKAVADNIRIAVTKHQVNKAGPHKIRIWGIDPGVVIQRLVVTRGDLPRSKLGPVSFITSLTGLHYPSDITADDILDIFLTARTWLRVDLRCNRRIGNGFEVRARREQSLASIAVPSGVTVGDQRIQFTALDHRCCIQQAARKNVDTANMAVEQVGCVDALAADLGVEIIAAILEAAVLAGYNTSRS